MLQLKNKLIIIEGQDNCGKTTLIRSLKKQINNPKILTLSSSGPPKNCMNRIWNNQHYTSIFDEMNTLLNDGFDIIMDRFHIGETCYGPLFRNMNADFIWDIEKKFLLQNQDRTNLIILTDNGVAISDRDDGFSIEKSPLDFNNIKELFEYGYDLSNIQNKQLLNITDDGWPCPISIYNWIYGETNE